VNRSPNLGQLEYPMFTYLHPQRSWSGPGGRILVLENGLSLNCLGPRRFTPVCPVSPVS